MFKMIGLENFRSFTDVTFDLRSKKGAAKPYALVYGENGSGKTNLIESVSFLKQSMKTLTMGDDISVYRRRISSVQRGGDEDSALIDQALDLTEKALGELEAAASTMNICDYVRNVKTIGSDAPMHLTYVFTVNDRDATYDVTFSNEGRVIHESLNYFINSRTGRYFEITGGDGSLNIKFGTGLFTNRKFKAQMKELTEKLWGNHTFLALVYAEYRRSNTEYMQESIRPEMLSVISSIDETVVCSSQNGQDPKIWPIELITGTLPAESEHILDSYETAIDTFFTRLYSDVGKVYYSRVEKDGILAYKLMFSKRISGIYREIPATAESAGTRKLLSMLPAFLRCAEGTVVFIDELDSGIHDKLIHDLMAETFSSVSGQMVITTHNTSLIRNADPSRVYMINLDAVGNKEIYSIDTVARTQKNHNNAYRYMDGQFGGVPYIGIIDFEDISEALDDDLGRDS